MVVKFSDFNENFRSRLYEHIKEVEKVSSAEIVVIVRASSDKYRDVALWSGFVLQIMVAAFMLFSPIVFSPYTICASTLLSFLLGYLFVQVVYPLKRLLVPSHRKQRAVEIYARAVFQKGKIYYTRDHTGLLIFVSLFERMVYLVPDVGLQQAIPQHVWQQIQDSFSEIFNGDNFVTEALLSRINELKRILKDYLPVRSDDINEIPDDLKVDL